MFFRFNETCMEYFLSSNKYAVKIIKDNRFPSPYFCFLTIGGSDIDGSTGDITYLCRNFLKVSYLCNN